MAWGDRLGSWPCHSPKGKGKGLRVVAGPEASRCVLALRPGQPPPRAAGALSAGRSCCCNHCFCFLIGWRVETRASPFCTNKRDLLSRGPAL